MRRSRGAESGGDLKVMVALDIPEEHSYIGLVRQTVRTLLEHHHAAATDIDDVETVLGELCANVTRHAHSECGCYRVTLEHDDSCVVVIVTDQGCGFDPQELPPVGAPRQDADGEVRIGGFGLPLVRALADHVEVRLSHPRGTTVRAEKRLSHLAPAAVR